MVSGFILSYSEMRRLAKLKDATAAKISTSVYLQRRLGTMWPIYIVGMIAAIISVGCILGMSSLPPANDVLAHFLLIQSWTTPMVERGLSYMTQCWFMSCLLFYWVIFHKAYRVVSSLSINMLFVFAAFLSVGIPLAYQLVTIGHAEWYSGHQYLSYVKAVDVATTTLKYHPLAYLHIFVLGCCLPRLREALLQMQLFQRAVPFVSLICYGALTWLYVGGGENVPGYKLSFRLGLFSFIQAMLLIGLCNATDIVARLFCHPVLKRFGLYSYPQYIFQFMAYAWYSELAHKEMVDIRYFLLLFSTAVVSWTLVSRFNGALMKRFVVACIPLLIMYLILQPFLVAYDWPPKESSGSKSNPQNMVRPAWWNDTGAEISCSTDTLLAGKKTNSYMVQCLCVKNEKCSDCFLMFCNVSEF